MMKSASESTKTLWDVAEISKNNDTVGIPEHSSLMHGEFDICDEISRNDLYL